MKAPAGQAAMSVASRNLEKHARTLSALASALVATASFAIVVCWFRPGILHSDSLYQLWSGHSGVYTDHHPVVMAWLMGVFDRVVPGPLLSLVLQCALFFAGVAMITHLAFERPSASLLIAVIGFWPPILVHLAVVQKDTQMSAALVFAVGLLALAMQRRLAWPLVAVLPALFYAQACRHNGLLAVAPLLFLWSEQALPRASRRALAALALTCVLLTISTGVLAFIAVRLTRGQSSHPAQQIFLQDLAALSVREGTDLLPDYLHSRKPELNLAWIRARFHAASVNDLVFGPDTIPWDGTAEERASLRAVWWQAVRAHPLDYASARLELFAYLLGLRPGLWFPVFTQTDPGNYPMRIDRDDSRYRRLMSFVSRHAEEGVWFRPWFYCAALFVVAFFVKRSLDSLGLCLLVSAATYLLGYLPASASSDFRYSWWAIVCALILPVVAVMERRNQAVDQRNGGQSPRPDGRPERPRKSQETLSGHGVDMADGP